jgi:hypothetical protein
VLAELRGLSLASEGSPPVRVFLVPAEHADEITSPDDGRLIGLGRMRIDEAGIGHLRFTIPRVPPGDYATLTHCVPCAASSAGRELLPTGPFPGHFVVLDPDGDKGLPLLTVALCAIAAIALGLVSWLLLRRRVQPAAT